MMGKGEWTRSVKIFWMNNILEIVEKEINFNKQFLSIDLTLYFNLKREKLEEML